MNVIAACGLKLFTEFNGLRIIPTALNPVGCGNTHADRDIIRDRLAHRVENFQREAHAIFQRTAIFIFAVVAERRQELMQQIAVRSMQLNKLDAEFFRAFRAFDKLLFNTREVVATQFQRRAILFMETFR